MTSITTLYFGAQKKVLLYVFFIGLLIVGSNKIYAQMTQVVTLQGKYSFATDGCGTNNVGCNIFIEKPIGATTVEQAWAVAGRSPHHNLDIPPNTVRFNNAIVPNLNQIVDNSQYGDVTADLRNVLNAAAAGTTITIRTEEAGTTFTEGVSLFVVWNNPSLRDQTAIVLSLGSVATNQGVNGVLNFPLSLDTTAPGFRAYFGTAISFSTGLRNLFFPNEFQLSSLFINGVTATTQLGGFDDGANFNGQLYTSGGFGDSVELNNADELIDIEPFISNGDASVRYTTASQHQFDFIHAAYVVAEGIRSKVVISQIYHNRNNTAVEVTNLSDNTVPGGTFNVALYANTAGDQTDVTPSATYNVSSALLPNQSLLIESSGFTGANINNSPRRVVNRAISSFRGGNDLLILSTSTGNRAWQNRFDVVSDFSDTTSYVRNDDVTDGNDTFSSSEWTAFVNDNLDPYRGPQRHPHDPLISEVNTSTANKNMSLGYHREGGTTRTGTAWSNGEPDRSRRVFVNRDYNHTGSAFSAKQLTVNNSSTFSITNNLLIVSEGINLAGGNDEIRLIGNSQLITTHTRSTQITGNGKLLVDQDSDVPSLYRYNYFGSPVDSIGQNYYTLTSVLKDGTTPLSESSTPVDIDFVHGFDGGVGSPIAISTRWIYTFTSGSWEHRFVTDAFGEADGFIFKGPGAPQNYTFVGTPKDGTIQTTVGANNAYLLGNPYASSIRASKFIEDNLPAITGTLYFWEQKKSAYGETDGISHNHSGYKGGYAIRNLTMGIAADNVTGNNASTGAAGLGEGDFKEPSDYIALGQGFFVVGDSGGTIEFNNSQREYILEGNDPSKDAIFFRAAPDDDNSPVANRYRNLAAFKLGMNYLNHQEGFDMHRQIGIAFLQGKTFDFEKGYDSPSFGVGQTDIYWDFPESDSPYVIAGVGPVSDEMQVPLTLVMGYDGDIQLMIDEIGGINKELYLFDKLEGKSYLFGNEPITLSLAKQTYKDRFFITFQNNTVLSNPDEILPEDSLNVYADQANQELVLTTKDNILLKEVTLYNILGKTLMKWKDFEPITAQKETRLEIKKTSPGIYLVNVITEKGNINKKIYLQ